MKTSFYINMLRTLCAGLCLALLFGALCIGAAAGTVTDYSVTVDNPTGISSKNSPAVIKNYELGTSPVLTVEGWIKTDLVMSYYEYTMDGGATWVRADAVVSRPDVKSICPKTYQTAGYSVKIDVSGLARGKYDLFLRGVTDKGEEIDVLAMLDVAIGHTDTQTTTYTELNLMALAGAQGGKLTLEADVPVQLGAYNLRNYQSVELILDGDAALTLQSSPASLLLFSVTSDGALENADGTYTATISLQDVQYAGDIMLWSAADVGISRIRLYTNMPDYYQGELVVHMTSTPYEFLSGANAVDATLMVDDTVGTYMRLYPVTDTNDPYIYFNLGKYLDQTMGVKINADDYGYAVITLQTPETNSQGRFRLFLCAGDIHGPHGDSHVSFQATNDGEWRTYVVPLCVEEYWSGTVYGMRFDFIDSHAKTTDYANIASIGFYPDEQSAKEAAKQPLTVYHEQGAAVEDIYKEEGRAPSGKADAITWFDESLSACFGGENKSRFAFDEYGHLLLQAAETTNDPFISFDLRTYASLTGQNVLRADEYGVVVLRVLADKAVVGKNFTLYYYAGGYDYAQGTRAKGADFEGGKWEYLVYDMSEAAYWTDEIWGFRLDFATQISVGQRVCLADMLFFADMAAWETYAAENGIAYGDGVLTDAPHTEPPETEMPTIEVPTQGSGLEYIPPEQFGNEEQGCKSAAAAFVLLLAPLAAVVLLKKRKGEQE